MKRKEDVEFKTYEPLSNEESDDIFSLYMHFLKTFF